MKTTGKEAESRQHHIEDFLDKLKKANNDAFEIKEMPPLSTIHINLDQLTATDIPLIKELFDYLLRNRGKNISLQVSLASLAWENPVIIDRSFFNLEKVWFKNLTKNDNNIFLTPCLFAGLLSSLRDNNLLSDCSKWCDAFRQKMTSRTASGLEIDVYKSSIDYLYALSANNSVLEMLLPAILHLSVNGPMLRGGTSLAETLAWIEKSEDYLTAFQTFPSLLLHKTINSDSDVFERMKDIKAAISPYDEEGNSLLSLCNRDDRLEEAYLLTPDINHKNKKGETALHRAVYHRNLNKIRFLLIHGADSNIKDKYGETFWTLRPLNGHDLDDLSLFEKAYALTENINHKNDMGETPLHCAARSGNSNKAYFLLTHGANPTIKNNNYETFWTLPPAKSSQLENLDIYRLYHQGGQVIDPPMKPPNQRGGTCAMYAVHYTATLLYARYPESFQKPPIPARKGDTHPKAKESLRSLYKGSGKGEIFSVARVQEMIKEAGCESKVYPINDYDEFKHVIDDAIAQKLPLIIPFASTKGQYNSSLKGYKAHWASITGVGNKLKIGLQLMDKTKFFTAPYLPPTNGILVAQWGYNYSIDPALLFNSFFNIKPVFPMRHLLKEKGKKWEEQGCEMVFMTMAPTLNDFTIDVNATYVYVTGDDTFYYINKANNLCEQIAVTPENLNKLIDGQALRMFNKEVKNDRITAKRIGSLGSDSLDAITCLTGHSHWEKHQKSIEETENMKVHTIPTTDLKDFCRKLIVVMPAGYKMKSKPHDKKNEDKQDACKIM
jgi:Ankyrin repeats (many copies)/Ankyrin repeat